MIRAIAKIMLMLISVVGIYLVVLFAQIRAAANLCDSFPIGSQIESLEDIGGTFLLTRMGPLRDPTRSGAEKVVFCASLTICETSCRLEIEDGRVKHARHSSH